MAGLQKGDNVLFLCTTTVESLSLVLGLLHAGITVTMIDPFTSDDLFIEKCSASKVIHTVASPLLYAMSDKKNLVRKISRIQVADINKLELPKLAFSVSAKKQMINARKWLSVKTTPDIDEVFDADSPALIILNSGITSEPNGSVYSFGEISASIPKTAKELDIQCAMRVYSEPLTVGLVALSLGAEWIVPVPGEKAPPNIDVSLEHLKTL